MSDLDFSGQQVGRFRLSYLLGTGAAGNVYRAVDTTLEGSPPFAIKCVSRSHVPRRRCQQMAEIENHSAAIGCPNVMMLYDVIEEDRYFFFILPLCKMDMHRAIWRERLYLRNDGLIKKVFIDILDGVLACHRKGIFHRDLKPENIMCDTDGSKILIGDFGLSSDRRLCRDGGCGTAAYMSPECLNEEGFYYYADLADVWSLGVILFNMVTSRYPWEEARPTDKAYTAFCSKESYLLRTLPISEPLSDLLHKIWHPIPMKRMSIPAIREAIVDMDTFYRAPPSSHARSPLSKELVLVDSQRTCVAPAANEKKRKTAPVHLFWNAPLCLD